ncbi:MAG: outer membrane beta-barrel domain-containing protein [Bacteriovoracaceae bacterium]|nr:outer membrane beta-barrel domain-containing protein [Bacteriovoracaceae bacterium]
MKKHLLITLFVSTTAFASVPLEQELNSLAVPSDTAMTSTAKDKLYTIQSRFAPLKNRHEISFAAGKNLNQDGHLVSNQFGAQYRYHINDKWALGGNFFKVNNELSSSGKKLLNDNGVIPDRDFVKTQMDAMVEYNLFYGKMRLDMDKVVYFDQYWGIGAGQVQLGRSTATAAVLDAGIAFWMGKWGSARLGMKNDFYKEQNLNGSTSVHNMIGYLAFGMMLGGEK